jgi:hypothetical protein
MKTESGKQKAEIGKLKTEMEEHECVPLCLTLGAVGAGVWKRDKMSHWNPWKFAIHPAKFTTLFRLNPSRKIKAG